MRAIMPRDVSSYSYAGTNYANPHAVTSVGGAAYAYDNNGNVTSIGSLDYTWDWRNRLASAERDGGSTSSYGYDHTDQRVFKATGSATTSYPNRYYNTTGATTTKHIFTPDGTLLATVIGTGTSTATTKYLHPDHLGGTNVVTDAAGDIVQILDYYPYGSKRIATGSFDEQRRFTGEEYDVETEFSYLNARYYEGSRGQFLSQDPAFVAVGTPQHKALTGLELESYLSDPQGANSYSYARNNPLRLVDTDGQWAKEYLSGQQSFHDFQAQAANYNRELGDATQLLTQESRAWDFAVSHPYISGGAIGLFSGGAAYTGTYGVIAFKYAGSPGVGLPYVGNRLAEGALYSYPSQGSLRNIPDVLEKFHAFDSGNLTFGSAAKLIFDIGLEAASFSGGETVGGIIDTINLFGSAAEDLSSILNQK